METAPPGADYGNYLTQVDILQGNDLRGLGLRHQPVFFVFLDLLTMVFDEFTALKVAAATVFSIIIFPFFMLTKKLSGSYLAAEISTAIFAFFISYTEMISWGGNPNFLAFSFLLTALFFIFEAMGKESAKNLMISGFFLSLVVGTHMLVAIFAFGSLTFFVILYAAFIKLDKKVIKRKIKSVFYLPLSVVVFSLPYVPFYITFFRNSSKEIVTFRLLELQFGDAQIAESLLTFAKFFVIIAATIAGVFALAECLKVNKSKGLLISSLFLAPLTLFLITVQPLRWLYFLPIPILLCFSISLGNVISDIRQVKKTAIVVFAALFTITLAVQSVAVAGERFGDATNFYQFIKDDEIQALNWIKTQTPPNSVFATSGFSEDVGGGGNSYAWWVEGYANRICMFTGDLEFYSFQFERDQVRTTNNIFAGTYVVDNGKVKVTESYPAGLNNPQIWGYSKDRYEKLLTLSDFKNQLFLESTDAPGTITIAPFYSQNNTSTVQHHDSGANITVTYENSQFSVTRSVTLDKSESAVHLVYRVVSKNSTINQLKINLWSLFKTSPQNCEVNSEGGVSLLGKTEAGDVKVVSQIQQTDGKLEGVKVFFDEPGICEPVANYIFRPIKEEFYVHFKIEVNTPNTGEDGQIVEFYDAYVLLRELKIDYLLVNRNRDGELQRFLSDSEHFTAEFQNKNVIIFKVSK
ncbi:MAG: glycosyltransferase family 39 protein [Candidatus Bathyarchaeota archaeon]|nr:glycosyltransferase family 39 protein [Candidatus Bathyarchaeota archaeon]